MAKKKATKKAPVTRATGPRVIDYTKMKENTVVSQWAYRDKNGKPAMGCSLIAVCPKCGRCGEERVLKNKDGVETSRRYDHVSEVVEHIPGFPLNMIREHCEVLTEAK